MATLSLLVHLVFPFFTRAAAAPTQIYSAISVGMTTQQLFQAFGNPEGSDRLILSSGEHLQYFFRGEMCQWRGQLCSVVIKNGRVVSSLHVAPALMEDK